MSYSRSGMGSPFLNAHSNISIAANAKSQASEYMRYGSPSIACNFDGIQIPSEWFQESPGRNGAGTTQNGIPDAQIECRRLPTLDLGVINKQPLLSLNHHHRPRRPPTLRHHVTNGHHHAHQPPIHNERATPQPQQGRRLNATSPVNECPRQHVAT
ncbi:uncharacterized protein LACBIDRAFT_331729 [Laccaria bicolor S238N-H82]|uniref:Predicted protein n=1 Tax=Laccaria bicolor (strain S238N-H82 / ATCC MYA-4686) TaxID=486041 RepID=B0DQD2_LACBS|nr:uncharacterized protein LACBIDRAFT_331729 [Laccaria bicolor S238N-H82]EDR03275.1 predicted protein [Laccaria bicolor S238N-H82]|eukprot:XP_001886071.1 predicted protein [Laccaria bicolor S238N-H82]